MISKVRTSTWWPWLVGLGVILALALLWKPVSQVGTDLGTLRRWIESLGPLAPLAFFGLNVAQIVVAPIPGYPVQVLGGILFGVVAGSVYTVGGMVAGGTLAAWLGRRLGRPWLEQRLGPETLAHWGKIAHIDSFWTWWVILLLPLGDLPYFFAGLSRVRLSRFALAILTSRGPFTILIVWAGDRIITMPLSWIALFAAGLGLVILAGFSQRRRLEHWGRRYLARRLPSSAHPAGEPPPQAEDPGSV